MLSMGNGQTKIHDAWEGAATTMCGLRYGTKALEARAITCETCLRVRAQWERERAHLARRPKSTGKRRPRHA